MNKWLLFGIVVFVALMLGAYLLINSEIFWGVFVASFLSFCGSVLLEKWLEAKENQKNLDVEKSSKEHAQAILHQELEQNFKIASDIQTYLREYGGLSDSALKQRKDVLFYRFSSITKDALWHKILQMFEVKALKEIQELYLEYHYLNHLLNTVCDYIAMNIKIGHDRHDYKTVLDQQPWSILLNNSLAQCTNKKEEILKSVQKMI